MKSFGNCKLNYSMNFILFKWFIFDSQDLRFYIISQDSSLLFILQYINFYQICFINPLFVKCRSQCDFCGTKEKSDVPIHTSDGHTVFSASPWFASDPEERFWWLVNISYFLYKHLIIILRVSWNLYNDSTVLVFQHLFGI